MKPVHERSSRTEAKPSNIEKQDPYFLAIPVLEQIEREDEKTRRKSKAEKTALVTEHALASPFKFEPPSEGHESGTDLYQQAWAFFMTAQIFLIISYTAAAISLPAYLAAFFLWGVTIGRFTRGSKLDYKKNMTGRLVALATMISIIAFTNIFLPTIALPFWYFFPGMATGLLGVNLGEHVSLPRKNK